MINGGKLDPLTPPVPESPAASKLTRQEKVDLINTLHHKVTVWDADGETCYYVMVPLDEETAGVLGKLGASNKDIMANARWGWDKADKTIVIDLTIFGFQFAKWWYSDSGFSLTKG